MTEDEKKAQFANDFLTAKDIKSAAFLPPRKGEDWPRDIDERVAQKVLDIAQKNKSK